MRERIMTILVSVKIDMTTKARIKFLQSKEVNLSEEYRQLVEVLYKSYGGK